MKFASLFQTRWLVFGLPILILVFSSAVLSQQDKDAAAENREDDWVLVNYDRGLGGGDFKTNRNAGTTTLIMQGAPEGQRYLKWSVAGGEPQHMLLVFFGEPRDLSPFSTLRFYIKSNPGIPNEKLEVRLLTDRDNEFVYKLPPIGEKWIRVKIPFFSFRRMGSPDITRIKWIALLGFRNPSDIEICVDDFRLQKGEGAVFQKDPVTFDDELHYTAFTAYGSSFEMASEGGAHLLWHVPDATSPAWMVCTMVPADIRKYDVIRFRLKSAPPLRSSDISVRLRDADGSVLWSSVPEPCGDWTALSVPIPLMKMSGPFDPARIAHLEWVLLRPRKLDIRIDDLEYGEGKKGEKSWDQETSESIDLTDPRRAYSVSAEESQFRLSRHRKKIAGIDWQPGGGGALSKLRIGGIPRDLDAYDSIKITLKASRTTRDDELNLQLFSGSPGALADVMPVLNRGWRQVTMKTSGFLSSGTIDRKRLTEVHLVAYKSEGLVITVKAIRFIKGKSGRSKKPETMAQHKARVFGRSRGGRAADRKTDHFLILTDSKAALETLDKSLEAMREFVTTKLGLPESKGRLPVYAFQRRQEYVNFCVDCSGMSRNRAERTGGHGCRAYLALVYTRPDDPVVVHELTHSLVHRTLGACGGAWIHEGFAVFTQLLYQKKDPGKEFASRLKSANYSSLYSFLTYRTFTEASSTSDSDIVSRLYDQAGSFMAFLREGPMSDRYEAVLKKFLSYPSEPGDAPKLLEKALGCSLNDIEKAWKTWSASRR